MASTLRLRADQPDDVRRAAAMLRDGGLVAFPTETVYGLGANALSAAAVERIFAAKQRPSWDPLIVHVPDTGDVPRVAEVAGELARRVKRLAEAFWPGPMTLLLPRRPSIPDAVTAGRAQVGVRVPAHPVAQQLLRAAGLPIAAPSANRFGHTSPTTAEHVLADLAGRIDAVLDGGPCAVGVESTVVDPAETPMVIYRAGAVTAEPMAHVTGVQVSAFLPVTTGMPTAVLPSPGVGMRHYAPEIPVWLSEGRETALWRKVEEALAAYPRVGVLLPRDWHRPPEDLREQVLIQDWGWWLDEASLARELFSGLRALEISHVSLILCPLPMKGGFRDALRDRLLKAAKPPGSHD